MLHRLASQFKSFLQLNPIQKNNFILSYLSDPLKPTKRNNGLIAFILISFASQLVSCGGESLSSNVDLILEENPLVINANFTLGSGDDKKEIKGPWYIFRYKLKNGTEATLKLVTFRFKVTGVKGGKTQVKEHSINPGENCAEGFSRSFIAIVDPKDSFNGYTNDGSGKFGSACQEEPVVETDNSATKRPISDKPLDWEGWYLSDLPPSDDFIYTVEITGEGWFEKDGEIKERAFIQSYQFTQ